MKLTKEIAKKYFLDVNDDFYIESVDGKEYLYNASQPEYESDDEGGSYFDAVELGQDIDLDDDEMDADTILDSAEHVHVVYPRREGVPGNHEIQNMSWDENGEYREDAYCPYNEWSDIYDTEHPYVEA